MKLDGWSVNTHNHFTKKGYTVRPYVNCPKFFNVNLYTVEYKK